MRALLTASFSAALLSLGLAACSSEPRSADADADGPIGRAASAVINGELDTTHQAVVALVLQEGQQGGLCSGTIIKVDPATKIGWVLTAAHCVDVPPVLVLQGDDFTSMSALRYEVLDYAVDSRYGGNVASSYDFAVVRILGVDATTPTIPLVTSPDGLANATPVVSVGYGRTTLLSSGSTSENTVRRKVSRALNALSSTKIAYDMTSRGICQGDSGGPVLVQQAGIEKVAGVHSYVEGDCNGDGVSGRAIAALSFVATELAKPAPPATCTTCDKAANSGNGECATLTRACLADKECSGFYQCLQGCAGTLGCKATCTQKFPKAEGPFTAATACTCTRACTAECGGSAECRAVPKCGYRFPAGACSTCTESACCTESFDCMADGTCYACLKGGDADPACASNPQRKALATCVASKCKDACAGSGLDTGAEPQADEPIAEDAPAEPAAEAAGATTRTTTTGCSASATPTSGAGRDGAPLAMLFALALTGGAAARRRRSRPRT